MLVSNKKSVLFIPKLAEPTTCIVGIQMPVRSPNLEGYYDKGQTDSKLDEKLNIEDLPKELSEALDKAKKDGIFDNIIYIKTDIAFITEKTMTQLLQARDEGDLVRFRYDGWSYVGFVSGAYPNASLDINATDFKTRIFSLSINNDGSKTFSSKNITTDDTIGTLIDNALLEAKESGYFKGEQGEQGEQGIQGERGERGEKGQDGQDGKDGANGISATHSWNGTTLTITSASGTSSANLKGERGEKGEQGIQGIQGEKGADGAKGEKGDTGATGYTPVKGTDYFTDADKKEFFEDLKPTIQEYINTALEEVENGTY